MTALPIRLPVGAEAAADHQALTTAVVLQAVVALGIAEDPAADPVAVPRTAAPAVEETLLLVRQGLLTAGMTPAGQFRNDRQELAAGKARPQESSAIACREQ